MIEVKTLSCGYENHTILEDVSFSLAGNAHLSILGSNGSGKSTLAKALSGLIGYKGSLKVQGKEFADIAALQRARMVSYIPAKIELFEQYTSVEDFILLGRYAHKQPYKNYTEHDHEKVAAILEEMQLGSLADQNIHTLSSGQQQLVLIAQALVQESDVIIFDEPTANLDPANSVAFALQLKALQAKGMTTILITHELNLARSMAGTILFIEAGTSHYYAESDRFFTQENLQQRYGIAFGQDVLGVSYG